MPYIYIDPSAWESVYETAAYPIYSAILGGYALSIVILAIYKQTVIINPLLRITILLLIYI